MSVIIGIDPHKRLHAACAIDETEREVAQLQVTAGECQLEELLEWAARFATRTWAIESAGGLGYLLAQQLIVWRTRRTSADRAMVCGCPCGLSSDRNRCFNRRDDQVSRR